MYKAVNSQACEQLNGIIKRVRKQLMYMRSDTALKFMRKFICRHNNARNIELKETNLREFNLKNKGR